jgi:hypothetical protein
MAIKDFYVLALFFLGTAGVIAGIIAISLGLITLIIGLWNRLLIKNYKLLASRLGWIADLPPFRWNPFCTNEPFSIKGVYRDRSTHVYPHREGYGKHSKSYTVLTMGVKSAGAFEFDVLKQGFFKQFFESERRKDIHTGDEDFDRAFIVKSNDEPFMRGLLTPHIMSRMMELNDRYKGFNVTFQHGSLRYKRAIDIISKAYVNEFKEMIDFFADLADQIEIADKIEMVWDDEVIESGPYRHVIWGIATGVRGMKGTKTIMKMGLYFLLLREILKEKGDCWRTLPCIRRP